ncbi:uncharacterized protein LOC119955231 [Scyliorhinus canicula]|uniref:uncharacterized protein LOC119955231 n=1 Tax=Scyliorhinus canicula TaxID=7830 RepID=UPI0018F7BDB4|nr:uncharacterized protein LOC119955231 [Scyliorhinus canicula]XP_038637182.1 uncharacterized protein LOC119955231 [Scyliorhinus canicula]XP_038637184.1 uncharacterized protein LOC119955231 [Scyliorhinus canicula]XP_038637185.1 uncharacterized protein LOC119955231 [Scyliorhinus canicula]XP_038637186.1 uncharacterized protein LOC119955231 [Scyliorhinus canicula]
MGPSDAGEVNSLMDPSSTDDSSFEYRILMAYAKRTWPKDKAAKADTGKADKATLRESGVGAEYHVGPNQQIKVKLRQTDKTQSDGKKKSHARKSKGKRKSIWSRIPCFRGESEKSNTPFGGMDEQDNICKSSNIIAVPEAQCDSEPSVNEVVDMLQKIMNPKNFRMIRSCSLEVDVGDEQKTIEQIISLLSREGDIIENEIKQDPNFSRLLGEKPSLSIFNQVMDSVLEVALPPKTDSELESETERKLKMIAFVVHATTRFAADGNHPMAQIMGFGTKYLQENCISWVAQKGGWAKLIEEEHID